MLKEIIDQFYLDRQKERPQTSFYVSEAGKCPRAIFLKFKNAPKKEFEAAFLRLFDHGESMHRMIMKALLSTRDIHVVASEVDIPNQEIIRGRSDAILSDGKELFVLDIKSMNSILFRKLDEPKPENILQLQLYLHYFKINKGILLYVDKDRLGLKEFIVTYNPAVVEPLIANLEALKTQIEANTLPGRIADYPSSWQCQFCQYREVCRLAKPDEMTWEELKAKIEEMGSGLKTA